MEKLRLPRIPQQVRKPTLLLEEESHTWLGCGSLNRKYCLAIGSLKSKPANHVKLCGYGSLLMNKRKRINVCRDSDFTNPLVAMRLKYLK